MSIIAFNYSKITAERKGPAGKYSVKNQTTIKAVKEINVGKNKALGFSFVNSTTYDPGVGSILIEGDLVVMAPEEQVKKTVASFQKDKSMDPALSQNVYNAIIQRTTIQTIILSRDMGLPPPLRLPSVTAQAREEASKTGSGAGENNKAQAKVTTPPKESKDKPKKK